MYEKGKVTEWKSGGGAPKSLVKTEGQNVKS